MKEQARQKIGTLVDRFRENIDVYKRSAYKDAQVRCEFIDPFFEVLGRDVSNKQGFAEQYKVVLLEDTIKVGLSTRAPDKRSMEGIGVLARIRSAIYRQLKNNLTFNFDIYHTKTRISLIYIDATLKSRKNIIGRR